MAKNPDPMPDPMEDLSSVESGAIPLEDTNLDTELDLLANQSALINSNILADERLALDNHQLEFIQFLRLIKTPEQYLALADLYTDFELILTLQRNIDFLDENDLLGQPTLENSAKKTILLLDCVTRVLNNILRVKPEAPYLKEMHRVRKSAHLPVDQYYRVKSPDVDLMKSYTNFDQLKLLLFNSVHNRQVFDLLDTMSDRVLPQFKEFLKGLRRNEASTPAMELLGHETDGLRPLTRRPITPETEALLRQTIISLTNSFLSTQTQQPTYQDRIVQLVANLKEVYGALNDLQKTSAAQAVNIPQLQKQIEQVLLDFNNVTNLSTLDTPTNNTSTSFLFEVTEYLLQIGSALDIFYEQQPITRLDETYLKRLDLARNTVKHLRTVMKEEHYHEKAQLPFLNLKSFVYFAVKVIKDLNYLNPQLHRKYRYYIERNVLDSRLQEAFRHIPKENRTERRYTIPTLLELNRMLRIISRISPSKDDRTDYQLTYYWFRLVELNLRNLIAFLKTYPPSEPLASRFDSISFTLEMEAERVFGKNGHLAQLSEHSPLEEYIKRIEDCVGILGRALQENYLQIAQAYLPNLTREDLDKDYQDRIAATLLLREHTWCIWQVCTQAEQHLRTHIEQDTLFEIGPFVSGLLRRIQIYFVKFLPKVFYSDRVELKRTFNDLLNCATLLANRKGAINLQHLDQLRERIHVLTTLFASLSENIKNRSILAGKPFNEESALRTLHKYLQSGELRTPNINPDF
ncbi:MAG: hypothetical protein AB1489_07865 [Acidobacteriota bacterium]